MSLPSPAPTPAPTHEPCMVPVCPEPDTGLVHGSHVCVEHAIMVRAHWEQCQQAVAECAICSAIARMVWTS